MKHSLVLAALLASASSVYAADDSQRQTALEDLGRALFFDVNLSQQRTTNICSFREIVNAQPSALSGLSDQRTKSHELILKLAMG